MPPGSARRAGFTLIEVVVALALSAAVALLSHALFAACVEGAAAIRAARAATDRRYNAHRALTAVMRSVEVGGQGGGRFEGHRAEVGFDAWTQTADGWFERERAVLRVDGTTFVLEGSRSGRIVLADSVAQVELDYLASRGERSTWATDWTSPVAAPVAVRIRSGLRRRGQLVWDTVLVPIGSGD